MCKALGLSRNGKEREKGRRGKEGKRERVEGRRAENIQSFKIYKAFYFQIIIFISEKNIPEVISCYNARQQLIPFSIDTHKEYLITYPLSFYFITYKIAL